MTTSLADPRLLASFLVGGLWIAFTTLAADRFGSKIGGLIGGLPSTVLVSLFFIGLTQSPMHAAEATTTVPLGMGLNGLFLVAYAALVGWGFPAAVGAALLLWLALGSVGAMVVPADYLVVITVFSVLLLGSHLAFERWLGVGSSPGARLPLTPAGVLARATLGGLMIGLSVLMAQIAGPRFGGLFAAFPAVFLATITIGYFSRGLAFSRTVAKPLMVSGLVNVTVYASAVRLLYPLLGLWWGTLASFGIAVVSSLLTYRFIQRNLS